MKKIIATIGLLSISLTAFAADDLNSCLQENSALKSQLMQKPSVVCVYSNRFLGFGTTTQEAMVDMYKNVAPGNVGGDVLCSSIP